MGEAGTSPSGQSGGKKGVRERVCVCTKRGGLTEFGMLRDTAKVLHLFDQARSVWSYRAHERMGCRGEDAATTPRRPSCRSTYAGSARQSPTPTEVRIRPPSRRFCTTQATLIACLLRPPARSSFSDSFNLSGCTLNMVKLIGLLTDFEEDSEGKTTIAIEDGSGAITIGYYGDPTSVEWANTRASLG